jgi:hypothetical protein
MLHDDFAFVGPVVRLLAADGGGAAGVNTEFEVEDGKTDTGGIKAVPVGADDVDDGIADRGVGGRRDDKILVEFGGVALEVPEVNVSTGVRKWNKRFADGTTIALEEENRIVLVVAVIEGYVAIDGFGAPDFRGNVNDEERRERSRRGVAGRGRRAGTWIQTSEAELEKVRVGGAKEWWLSGQVVGWMERQRKPRE